MDVQGAKVVKPYTEQHSVTFPVAIDPADVFGRAFDLKAIPVSFLVDEIGITRLRGGGPSAAFLKQVETILAEPLAQVRGQAPELPGVSSRADLEDAVRRAPDDWQRRVALAEAYAANAQFAEAIEQCEEAAQAHPKAAGVHFTWGQLLLQRGEKEAALAKLKQARDLDPDNWRIRKQIWAIEHPDKFYTGRSPDFSWQKEELKREKLQ